MQLQVSTIRGSRVRFIASVIVSAFGLAALLSPVVLRSQTETLDRDAQLRLKVFAEWDLSRLIFDQDEYNAAKELSKIVTRREDLLTTINKLYFARRQLQAMALLSPAKTPAKALKYQIQLAGLTADLDALTGNTFSEAR